MRSIKVMHIGKYLPPVKGGIESSVMSLCEGLTAHQDIDLRLVGANTQFKRESKRYNTQLELVKLNCVGKVFSTPMTWGLSKEIRNFAPDVLHLHVPNPLQSLRVNMFNLPLVITYHCDVTSYPWLIKAYSEILEKSCRHAYQIVATSENVKKNSPILKKYNSKCSVIPLSIAQDFSSKSVPSYVQFLREKFGDRMILFVGRLVEYKGLKYLFEAMKQTNGHLVIVGTGPKEKELRAFINSNGLQNKITFCGAISDEDLPSYYQASRTVVLTSIDEREALGICLLEGLSFSRPLVTTNLGTGVTEVNINMKTGLTVPVRDSRALAIALKKILDNEELWAELSRGAREHFNAKFSLDTISSQYYEIYKRVAV